MIFGGQLIEPGVTFQHESDIGVTAENAGHGAERSGTHEVVVAHEEAVLAGSLLDQARADVGIVTEVEFVLVVAKGSWVSSGVITRDGSNLQALRSGILADHDLEIAAVLRVDGVEQRARK